MFFVSLSLYRLDRLDRLDQRGKHAGFVVQPPVQPLGAVGP